MDVIMKPEMTLDVEATKRAAATSAGADPEASEVTFTNLTDYVIGVFRFEHVAVEELDLEEVARTVARTLGVHLRTVEARVVEGDDFIEAAARLGEVSAEATTEDVLEEADVPEEEISAALEPLKLVYPTDPPPRVIYVEYVVTLRGARTRAPRSCGRAPRRFAKSPRRPSSPRT